MAFRIHESVVRGEIDNRVKGIVRGQIWLAGRAEPLTLELKGNAWPDLAGCLLTFTNPRASRPDSSLESLADLQRGGIGDLTASRKVRVFDVPLEQAMEMFTRKESPPEHLGNCLYLEWFSDANGRVVIESPDFLLTVSAPEWRMTPQEDAERARQAADGMNGFMTRLSEAIERQKRGRKDPEEPWDEHDYEKFLKESDARTDAYLELLDKYGDSPGAEEKIAREMGWERELTEEEAEEQRRHIDELNAAAEEALNEPESEPDPLREGIDWVRDEQGYLHHPLQKRCLDSAIKFSMKARELGLEESGDPALEDFVFEFQLTAAKLSGALGSIARGAGMLEAGFTVACLKRALAHLHKSQAGLEGVAANQLLPQPMVAEAREELFAIREAILRLMDELRGRGSV